MSFDSPVDGCFVIKETRENVVNGDVLDSHRDRQELNNNNMKIDVKIKYRVVVVYGKRTSTSTIIIDAIFGYMLFVPISVGKNTVTEC